MHPCRLNNLCKSELGKLSKINLERNSEFSFRETKLKPVENLSDSIISWFNYVVAKRKFVFIQFCIMEFYPCITENCIMSFILHSNIHLCVTKTSE